ncbi:MAG TPA: hypothetical protein VNN79_10885, partial [Actinomycetota bacterium]|nr:hypothetical protein [Actinomycetota bacterium]
DATLSWAGPGGSIGGMGEIFSVPAGRVVPTPGVTVRITLQNGDTTTIEPRQGLWMAVIGRCHDYVGTEVRLIEAIDANGKVLSSIPVDAEEPDPLRPWPPC